MKTWGSGGMALAGETAEVREGEDNLPQSHCVQQKPHTDCLDAEAGPNCLSYGTVYPEPTS
jgi:hypothetical protein